MLSPVGYTPSALEQLMMQAHFRLSLDLCRNAEMYVRLRFNSGEKGRRSRYSLDPTQPTKSASFPGPTSQTIRDPGSRIGRPGGPRLQAFSLPARDKCIATFDPRHRKRGEKAPGQALRFHHVMLAAGDVTSYKQCRIVLGI